MIKMMFGGQTLAEAEAEAKAVMDWAGLTTAQEMRAAATETIHAATTLYTQATGNPGITITPIIDGHVSLEVFDDAAADGTLADVPYMIGYTMNDMADMSAGIAAFCKDRQERGSKAWA